MLALSGSITTFERHQREREKAVGDTDVSYNPLPGRPACISTASQSESPAVIAGGTAAVAAQNSSAGEGDLGLEEVSLY